jgi:hypothetical protein
VTRRTLLTLAGLLIVPVYALAHEGHTHKLMGVVSMIHENHLEVKDAKGKASTFTLDTKTRVRRGKSILKAADIKTGDRVVVLSRETKDKATGKVTVNVLEVQLGTATTTAQK